MKRKMWTAQTPKVLEILEREGVTMVKKQYLRDKYGETAWIFLTAYDFMSRKLAEKVPQPLGAESPIWLFAHEKWAGDGAIPLELPEEELLYFDLRKWYRVLSLSYVGTADEEAAYDEKLRKLGITDSSKVFRSAFYPMQKREILRSWERIFDLPEDPQYIQAACWQLKKEWKC